MAGSNAANASILPQAFAAELDITTPESDSDMAVTEGSKSFTYTAGKITEQPKVSVQFTKDDSTFSSAQTIFIKAQGNEDGVSITEIVTPDGNITEGDSAQFETEEEGDYKFEVRYITQTDNGSQVFTYHLAPAPLSLESDFTFQTDTQTIIGYNNNAPKDVVVPAQINGVDVLHIGANVFAGQQLTSIVLPEGIQSIGDSAFMQNPDITSIDLPNSITSIGSNAFSNCDGLTSIDIPNGVTDISNFTFSSCDNLTSINIPEGVTDIGSNAFSGCIRLTNIDLPTGLTKIGDSAFAYCRAITSIDLPTGLTDIGNSAFSGCGFTSINLPGNLTEIGDSTFENCGSLTSINIPNGVTNIGPKAFDSCSQLASVTIPVSVTSIGNGAFAYCTSLTSIIIPDSVTSIGDAAFQMCYGLTSVTIPDSVTSIGNSLFYFCRNLTSVTLPDSITRIGDTTFDECSSLASIIIPDRVTSIGDQAFNECSSLASITIPDSVTSISYSAFQSCPTDIHIPTKNSGSIPEEPWASAGTVYWKDVIASDSWLFNRSSGMIIKYLGKDAVITMPKTLNIDGTVYPVKAFNSKVFQKNESITQVIISADIDTIPDNAFNGCINLSSITLPDSLTTIGNNAFARCLDLSGVTFPDGLTTIGYKAFADCGFTDITIPDSVTEISFSAFTNCKNLTRINIPGKVRDSIYGEPWGASVPVYWQGVFDVYPWVFDTAQNTIVRYLGTEATVDMPKTLEVNGTAYDVKAFTFLVFQNNKNITQVTIPEDVNTVPDNAFSGCSSLTSINIPDSVTTLGSSAFDGCSSLTSVYLPDSVTTVGVSVFRKCSSLTSIRLSNHMTEVVWSMFDGCSALTSINIPDSVTKINDFAFKDCSSLTSINIPDNVINIGSENFSGTFQNCSSLTSINIPDNITWIGPSTFQGCSSLTSIHIPDSVASIGGSAFKDCSSLPSIKLPNNLTLIDFYTFEGCRALTSLSIPDGVTELRSQAFSSCTSLTNITIPGSITQIGYAFIGNNNLKNIYVMRDRSTAPSSLTNSQPWGADYAKVKWLGDFISFEHTVDLIPGEYARNINIHAFINKGTINQIVLPDHTTISVANATWPEAGDYSYKVSARGNYLFKGTDSSGETIEYNVNVGPIGQPTVTANNAEILAADAPHLTEAGILALINAKAATLELGDNFTGGTLEISPEDVAEVQGLTTNGSSASVTVTATSPTRLTGSATVTVTARDSLTETTVTFNTNGGTPVPPVQNVRVGQRVTKPADPLKAGHAFDKWYRDVTLQTPWDFDTDLVNAAPVTLYAGYITATYEVKFMDWDNTQIGDTQKVEYGHDAIAPAAPTRAGYTFMGWDSPFTGVTKNLTVKAQYRQNTSGGDDSGSDNGGGNGGSGNGGGNGGSGNGNNSGGTTGNITAAEPPVTPVTPPLDHPGAIADPEALPAVQANPSASPVTPETEGKNGIEITPETSAAVDILPDGNGADKDEQTPAQPAFGKEGVEKFDILHWILWLATAILALYTIFRRRKNSQELERLYRVEDILDETPDHTPDNR